MMSREAACEYHAKHESGSLLPSTAYADCMGSSSYRNEHNIHATNREVENGTVPKVELTDGENLIVQLTGDNKYRIQQIAGTVRGDTLESDNMTSDDVDAVLAAGTLDGKPLDRDLRRALEYMHDNFHDMTDESLWNVFDTGDLSEQEILDYATNEIDASVTTAHQKAEQREEQLANEGEADDYSPSGSRKKGSQTVETADGREFVREKGNENVTYEVKKGDCVSRIAEDLMTERLRRKPTASELRDYIRSISMANGLTENGRNPDLIHIGEVLVFPPFDR